MWTQFEKKQQLGKFLDAAAELHAPLLEQMESRERPMFFHHWATQLNLSDCYVLEQDGKCVAMATYPRVGDRHYGRWQTASLAVCQRFEGTLDLPRPLTEDVHFTCPAQDFTPGVGFTVRHAAVEVTQSTYVRSLDQDIGQESDSNWAFGTPGPDLLDRVIELFSCRDRPSEGSEAYLDYYLPLLTWNIRRIHSSGTGHCFFAAERGRDSPIAAVFYAGWELPLAGLSCCLVDDILVLPEYRNRGIAVELQMYAYSSLHEIGVRWIAGNIDLSHPASLRQAEKAGRKPWTLNLRISPA